ncbi:RHS repeat-associated core domain-containing protein [Neotabrizicola sp. sgz301269]|uniref:RHS repeat domain-containing protein n=1 Tax=Neotabrizicola sp. sgz301269 TaxID=3276282 RepID=UPI003770562E
MEETAPAKSGNLETASPAPAESSAMAATEEEEVDGGQVGVPSVVKADAVGAGGAFTQRVEIAMPSFRDLPLQVSLAYNSSDVSRAGADKIVAFGWSLNGFSTIERKSLGGGVPTYDDGQDVYVLDGQELMACTGNGATNPWTLKYPLRYLTDRASASCSAGGNLVNRVEDYNRIVFDAATNTFTVTRPSGVKLIYTSLGALAGDASAERTPERNYATKARWLLTRIEDTQATPNVVTYSYYIAAQSNGYAYRPWTISYAGYRVVFDYRAYPANAIPKFATGTALEGRQPYQLRAIRIFDGTTPIRAYKLVHSASALTQTQLLSSVQEFGSDFVFTAPDITGGASLPAKQFTYSTDQVSFDLRTYTGTEFHEAATAADTNRDGSDELIFMGRTIYSAHQKNRDGENIYTAHALSSAHLHFDRLRQLSQLAQIPQSCADVRVAWPNDPTDTSFFIRVRSATTILLGDRASSMIYCLSHRFTVYVWGAQGNFSAPVESLNTFRIDQGSQPTQISELKWQNPDFKRFFIANLNLDPDLEAVAYDKFYSISAGVISLAGTLTPLVSNRDAGAVMLADLSGSGVASSLGYFAGKKDYKRFWSYSFEKNFTRFVSEQGYLNGTLSDWMQALSSNNVAAVVGDLGAEVTLLGTGDIDGDGIDDVVFHDHNGNATDDIIYFRSTGSSLRPALSYPLNINLKNALFFGNLQSDDLADSKSSLLDINADGLVDLVIHAGFATVQPAYGMDTAPRYSSYRFWVFLNTGNGFVQVPIQSSYVGQAGLISIGDFDGDGLQDFALEGANNAELEGGYTAHPGRILFGNSGIPNRLISVKNEAGGITTVSYAPSSDFGVNQMPGIQQVVKSITTDDGRGGIATTTYSYAGGAYDFINRKALGFGTVTATLPAIAGETSGPQIVTTYRNDHIAEYGLVASRVVLQGGAVQSRDIYDYTLTTTGNGPYIVKHTAERHALRYGSELVETRVWRNFDAYGQIIQETNLGFTSHSVNIDPADDITVSYTYVRNLAAYIVDRPAYRREEKGAVPLAVELADYVYYAHYHYDDNTSSAAAPTRGNLAKIWEKTADPNGSFMRVTAAYTYDVWGNVLTEKDAKGQTVATHTYDVDRHLFRLTTTNVLGHIATTAWNTLCQAPLTVTDPNARVTSFQYDALCRETRVDLPGGQYKITRYQSFGNPMAQRVQQDTHSGSTVAGKTVKVTRSYFDGLGRVYVLTSPGNTSAEADFALELRAFDARGNLAWSSIPLPWSSFGTTPTAAQRTSFTYDSLDRPLSTVFPDGAQKTLSYLVQPFSHFGASSVSYPTTLSSDEHCNDGSSAATVCGYIQTSVDANGHPIRISQQDSALSDTDAGTEVGRTTQYRYDLKGRLIAVVDPGGSTWAYTYDGLGNRLTSDDPGLGLWTLTYDANNNLLTQTDAKGQLISFEYDALNRVTKKIVGTGSTRVETAFSYDQVRSGYYNLGMETTQKVWLPATGAVVHEVERDYHITGNAQVERHKIDGRTYPLEYAVVLNGTISNLRLPYQPGSTAVGWVGGLTFDAASRVTAMNGYITSIDYNIWSQPTLVTYASGVNDAMTYSWNRGWLMGIYYRTPSNAVFARAVYTRTASGRISRYDSFGDAAGAYDFTYDYAGRLLTATNYLGFAGVDEVYSYDKAGRLRSKGAPGAAAVYTYIASKPDHAPHTLTLGGVVTTFTYDANGNMLTGLDGKVMTYDGENRPLSVTFAGKKTCYVYGADGKRLKKIDNLAPTQDCATIPASAPATVYFGAVEIRNWKLSGEQVITYPHPNVKLVNGKTPAEATYLHRDHLGSVRAITTPAGVKNESAVYKPFGAQTEWLSPSQTAPEDKGWIGERYDADAGLQYLNARYYDPVLGMFLQPDWFEVTMPGVGTNRYAYCGGNPVNCLDPGGNSAWSDFKDSLRDSWDAFKDAVSGRATHVDNAGQNGTGGDYGYVRVDGETYGCFGCRGTGEYAKTSLERAQRFERITRSSQNGPNNRITGLLGVRKVAIELEILGYDIWGFEVRTLVPGYFGPRIYDIVIYDGHHGIYVGVEVKSTLLDTIRLQPGQVAKDVVVAKVGGFAPSLGVTIHGVRYETACFGCGYVDVRVGAAKLIDQLTHAGIVIRRN